jgi:cellulose synthase/poly-beta-1,6-N-acetylglucosamine synthase-like glycosyltransferase
LSLLVEIFCLMLFLLLVALPSLYGFHMYLLMYLAHRRRRAVRAQQQAVIERYRNETPDERWPRVTTQLPLYNERDVARRVITAAAQMDYPAGRHEVQVLDDSTDETRQIVDDVAARLNAEGYDVKVVRRPTREHYKAGALDYGLKTATGELVAIFDADFVPEPGFLRRMVPLFGGQDDVCVVQGRWAHLNADESWVTRGLSLGLDLHFAIEQGARNWNGLLMSFNGTGGIWRKAAIDDPRVGGWSGDTITEDLDLSYRAQLAGWRMIYCVDEGCPAEIPSTVDALKAQQRRWATGTMQTARKLLPRIWRAPNVTLAQKLQATIHMSQYAIALPMILVALVGRLLPLMLTGDAWPVWTQWLCSTFLLAAIAPCLAYTNARYVIGGGIPKLSHIAQLVVLGLGLCVNNGLAVLTGLVQRGGEFVRTPKSGSVGQRRESSYRVVRSRLWLFELLLAGWCFVQWLWFLPTDGVGGLFLLLYAIGFFLMGWGSRPQAARSADAVKVRTRSAAQVPKMPRPTPSRKPEVLTAQSASAE